MTDDELLDLDEDRLQELLQRYTRTSSCGRILDAEAFATWAIATLRQEHEDSLIVTPTRSSRLLRVQRLAEVDDE